MLAAPVLRLQRASKHLWAPSSLGASAETSCCRRRSARRPTPAGSRCWGRYTLPFCPSKVCHLRPRRAVSAPGGVLGNLVDLNVSGRRARQEPLTGLQNTRKVLSLCPLTMAYSWSGALGPRVVPRAAHAVNSCLSVLSGLGVARMGRLACVFRALLCWRRCARDWLQSLGGL